MSIPTSLLTTTCDIYRPFGAGSPLTTGVACRLVPDLFRGDHTAGGIVWTHYLDLNETVDIKDGCTRTVGANAINYADGDEVRIPGGVGSTRFAVVWVEVCNKGTTGEFKRVYLMRH
jgi:hypothetical protein